MAEPDLPSLNLEVYDTKQGFWTPDHGELEMPAGWEFLAAGDTFVTRRVKAAGVYWTVWRPRGRNRPHRRKLGLLAPSAAIEPARDAAVDSAQRRMQPRASNARHRDKVEHAYRDEFMAAVLCWLDFTPEHAELAQEIAAAAARAVEVGSGRVGRTRQLPLEDRVALAARATIRHRFTDYEHHLMGLDPFADEIDDTEYRTVKHDAHADVDAFLCAHRRSFDDA